MAEGDDPTAERIVDCHVHLGWESPREVERPYTWGSLAEAMEGAGPSRSQTPEEAIAAMDSAYGPRGRAIVFPFNEGDRNAPDPDGAVVPFRYANDRVLEAARLYPERFVPFCRVDPDGPAGSEGPYAAVYELVRCRRSGAMGVKLHPRAQGFAADSPEAVAVARVAGALGMPVLVHSQAAPDRAWWEPEGAVRCEPWRVARLAGEAPGTAIVIGHSGSGGGSTVSPVARTEAVRQACDAAAAHGNVYLDLSITMPYSLEPGETEGPGDAEERALGLTDMVLARRGGYEGRVLYGSDLPFAGTEDSLRTYERVAARTGVGAGEGEAVKGGSVLSLLSPPGDVPVKEVAAVVLSYIKDHDRWNPRAWRLARELEAVSTADELEAALHGYVKGDGAGAGQAPVADAYAGLSTAGAGGAP